MLKCLLIWKWILTVPKSDIQNQVTAKQNTQRHLQSLPQAQRYLLRQQKNLAQSLQMLLLLRNHLRIAIKLNMLMLSSESIRICSMKIKFCKHYKYGYIGYSYTLLDEDICTKLNLQVTRKRMSQHRLTQSLNSIILLFKKLIIVQASLKHVLQKLNKINSGADIAFTSKTLGDFCHC